MANVDGTIDGPTVGEEDQRSITKLHEKLKGLEILKGTEHPESLVTVMALAHIYYDTRQLDLADKMYYRAFCGSERTHRPTHIIVYKTASNYGVCLIDLRRFDDAGM